MNGKTEIGPVDVEFEAVNQALANLWRKLGEHEGWREAARAVALMTQDLDRIYDAYKDRCDPL